MKKASVLLFLIGVVPFIFYLVWGIFHLLSIKHYYVAAMEIVVALVFLIAALFGFTLFYRGMFAQTPEQEADLIALRAWSYFESLGEK